MKVALISTTLRDTPRCFTVTRPELVECLTSSFSYLELRFAQHWEVTKIQPEKMSIHGENERETKVKCHLFHPAHCLRGDSGKAHSEPLPHNLVSPWLPRPGVTWKGTLAPRAGASFLEARFLPNMGRHEDRRCEACLTGFTHIHVENFLLNEVYGQISDFHTTVVCDTR